VTQNYEIYTAQANKKQGIFCDFSYKIYFI